jgi:AcrR family transcriptional regulator
MRFEYLIILVRRYNVCHKLQKKALAESLKKLMNTTAVTKITVNDIVRDCGVNRRTFYYHFQDIYALLEWISINRRSKFIILIPSIYRIFKLNFQVLYLLNAYSQSVHQVEHFRYIMSYGSKVLIFWKLP